MDDHWVKFQEKLNMQTLQNGGSLIIFDSVNGIPYEVFKTIGVSSDNLLVYAALKLSPTYADSDKTEEVAIQLCSNISESKIIARRWKGLDVMHENLLCLKNDFVTSDNVYVGVYPRMSFSMRWLLNNVYQKGLPEDLVGVVLGEVLKSLCCLHEEHGRYIYNLNSGTVYCKLDSEETCIKIGYGCAVYEHNSKAHPKLHKNHLDPIKICDWGCSPEIEGDFGRYSKKSETWLVGLLGLDLYLGGIRAKDRDDLMDLIERFLAVGQKWKRMGNQDEWKPCSSFLDFERKCLNKNFLRRPNTEDLLKHEFIGSSKNLNFFTQWVKKVVVERKTKMKC